MIKVIQRIFLFLILTFFIAGCGETRIPLLNKKVLDNRNITMIQVAISYNGNPDGKNDAKIITDDKEIATFINAFINGYIGEKTDTIYGNSSVFRFFENENLVIELWLSADSRNKVLYSGNSCNKCIFSGDDPWVLYQNSIGETVIVNKNFKIIN